MGIRDTLEYERMPYNWMQLTYSDPESDAEALAFWQYIVDTGMAFQLEGWFGRQAMDMIESGLIEPPLTT